MATKKTKSLTEVIEKLPAKRKAKIEKRTEELVNKPSGGWPRITQGTHLTVKTFENGHTELIWDDEALLNEVRDAILKAESTVPVTTEKPKRTKKVKNG